MATPKIINPTELETAVRKIITELTELDPKRIAALAIAVTITPEGTTAEEVTKKSEAGESTQLQSKRAILGSLDYNLDSVQHMQAVVAGILAKQLGAPPEFLAILEALASPQASEVVEAMEEGQNNQTRH